VYNVEVHTRQIEDFSKFERGKGGSEGLGGGSNLSGGNLYVGLAHLTLARGKVETCLWK
jgi:hypothetical protein